MKAKGRNEQAEHKKKTMKTTSKKSSKAQVQTEQSSTQAQTENTAASAPTPEQKPLPRISFKERRRNRALPTEGVLHLLRTQAPKFWELAEVVEIGRAHV